MEFKKRPDRIWMENERGEEIAFVSFPAREGNSVEIVSTVVDKGLRGEGIAHKLLDALAEELRSSGRKAIPTCSFAVKWFEENPEQGDLLYA